MGWATVLVILGAIAALFVVVLLISCWSALRHAKLQPPSVRGLAETPRYLEVLTEPARRRFEGLGFRVAGTLAVKPISETTEEIVQLVMRNEETRTVAYFHARLPFVPARPSVVSFESFLPDGSPFVTAQRSVTAIGPALPNRQHLDLDDDEALYRAHLAALRQPNPTVTDLPDTFEGLVTANVTDAARLWNARLDQGVFVPSRTGGFRYSHRTSLALVGPVLRLVVKNAVSKLTGGGGARQGAALVDARDPDVQQFLAEYRRRLERARQVAANRFKMSPARSALFWIALVVGFTIFWQVLARWMR